MYPPKAHRKNDPAFVKDLIRKHPFAEIISEGDTLLCSHIPILIDEDSEKFTLFGHLSNLNEQCGALKSNMNALLVFRGHQSFISAGWYRQRGGISTWDYSAVHIWVKCTVQRGEELLNSLKVLYKHLEGDEQAFKEIDSGKLKSNLKYITGFTFHPYKVESIAKWHQDHSKDDIRSIIHHLSRKIEPTQSKMLAQDIAREHGLPDSLKE